MSDQNNPTSADTTGHVWDDTLAELTNPPPGWWMIGLHASWIGVLVYSVLYPTWPLPGGHTEGVLGWTQIKEYKESLAEVDAVRAQYEDKLPGMPVAAILEDEELKAYSVRSAKVLFGDYCSACHGGGGAGNPNYPVLVDDDWLYGGSIETIHQSIVLGRQGIMPKGGGAQLSDAEIDKLAQAVVGGKVTSEPLFMEKGCIACHGVDGKGNPMLGAPNLTDGIYRFAASDQLASVKYTIKHGVNDPSDPNTRQAQMPSFTDRLPESDIKKLAVYVHELGGGQ
jgi:cytochrome c oxidase cbb3-type subunit 3